jgi:probable phosphoglycerate mutase
MMADKSTTRFGLIRHAETIWNRERRVQGQLDSPLTPDGQQPADQWGRTLKPLPWDGILASDTGRAVATAAIIHVHLNLAIETDPRLRELDWGRWTSHTIARIRAEEPQEVQWQEAAGWEFQPPGGESRRRQLDRSREALLDDARRRPGDSILVVIHEGVIKALAQHLCGTGYTPADSVRIKGHHLHWLSAADGKLALAGLNAMALNA